MDVKGEILIYLGSLIAALWGIAHIIPARSVINGFEPTTRDNHLIITLEWLAEGLALCFVGVLAGVVTLYGGVENPVSVLVCRASALMLLVMAGLTLATGARTGIISIKVCPLVKTLAGILLYLGS